MSRLNRHARSRRSSRPQPRFARRLLSEHLEARQMFDTAWHNSLVGADVNGDGTVTSEDATVVGQQLVSRGEGLLTGNPPPASPGSQTWLDVTNDGSFTIDDLTAVMNVITLQAPADVMKYEMTITDLSGNPLSSVKMGDTFLLKVYVQDLRVGGAGIANVGLDVNYSQKTAQYVNNSLNFSVGAYPETTLGGPQGTAGNGVLNDVYGIHPSLYSSVPTPGTAKLLAFQATFRVGGVADSFTINEDAGLQNFNVLGNDSQAGTAIFQTKGTENGLITPLKSDTSTTVVDQEIQFGKATVSYTSTGYSITGVTQGSKGTVAIGAGNTINYTPAANTSGPDTFTYTLHSSDGRNDTVTVTVNITDVNDPPIAVQDNKTTNKNTSLGFTLSGLLANDSPGAGETSTQTVQFVSIDSTSAQGGQVNVSGDNVTYIPPAEFAGIDTIKYRIRDSVSATEVEGTISISVSGINHAPTAGADSRSATEDTPAAYAINGATGLTFNDSANDAGQTLTFALLGTPNGAGEYPTTAGGKVKLDGAGNVLYTPKANYSGSDSFTYRVTDNGTTNGSPDPLSAQATVTISVAGVNDPPVLVSKTLTTNEDTTLSITHATLLTGQTPGPADEASQSLSIPSFATKSTVQGGTVSWSAGSLTYVPKSNYYGSDSFTVQVTDNGSPPAVSTLTVIVTVKAVNDPPTAGNDNLTANENVATGPITATITSAQLMANDNGGQYETDNTISIKSVATKSANGGTVAFANGQVTYTRPVGFSGQDSFTYVIVEKFPGSTSTTAKTATGTVFVNVVEFNDAPILVADTFSLPEDSPATTYTAAQLLANDKPGPAAEASQTMTITGVQNLTPSAGTFDLVGGNVVFTPVANFAGAAKFSYTVTDNGTTNGSPDPKSTTITSTVNVAAVNDQVDAIDDELNVEEGKVTTITAASLMANDRKGDEFENNQVLTFALVTPTPTAGGKVAFKSGKITFTPAPGFSGVYTFQYRITDNGTPKTSDVATVTLNVVEINDAPVAVADTFTLPEDSPQTTYTATQLVANDKRGGAGEESQTLTITGVTNLTPAGGTIELVAGNVVYTPTPNFSGPMKFTYSVIDNGTTGGAPDPKSATVTSTINVTAVNDPVDAVDDFLYVNEGKATVITAASLMTNDSKGDEFESSQVLTFALVTPTPTVGGKVALSSGKITFTPAAGFTGPYTFQYRITDNGTPKTTDVATVTLFVVNINDPPVAGADAKAAFEDTELVFSASDLTLNDTPGPANESSQHVSVTAVSSTSTKGGTVSLVNGIVTYTPPADYFGSDTFTYTVIDDGYTDVTPDFRSATGTVTINVAAVNDAPAPFDDSFQAVQNTGRAMVVRTNDGKGAANESTQTLTVVAVTQGSLGSLIEIRNGEIFYTPAPNTTGTETFTYMVRDNGVDGTTAHPLEGTATVTVDLVAYAPHNYTGRVYTDVDGDGIFDTNERGMAGVIISLTGTDDLGAAVSLQQSTQDDGTYAFLNLRPGNYTVGEFNGTASTQPKFTADGKDTVSVSPTLATSNIIKTVNDKFTIKGVAQKTTAQNVVANFGEKPITTTVVATAKQPQLAFLSSTGQKKTAVENEGVVLAVNRGGPQYWQSFQNGWAGVKSASLLLNPTNLTQATLTVVRDNDEVEVYELTTGNNQFEILSSTTASGVVDYVVRIKGSLDAIDAFFGGNP